jgi:release factor glutamine methyltransferase
LNTFASAGQLTIGHALAIGGLERREAAYLLRAVTGHSAAYLIAHADQPLPADELQKFQDLVRRRHLGEPLAYLVGVREFHGLALEVTPAVLIPRPETELLVDSCLERLASDSPAKVLDLGTGSGAVALAIATQRCQARIFAVDVSHAALELAARNRKRHGLTARVHLIHSDWFSAIGEERFDLIVSNPPYIAEGDAHLGEGDLRFEPRQALVGGRDGLDAIRRIVSGAPHHLNPGGWLLLEHGYDQAAAVGELLATASFEGLIEEDDLAGHPRVAGGRLTGS